MFSHHSYTVLRLDTEQHEKRRRRRDRREKLALEEDDPDEVVNLREESSSWLADEEEEGSAAADSDTDDDDSEGSLQPYDMSDDESELEQRKLPSQLRECAANLRKSDDPDAVSALKTYVCVFSLETSRPDLMADAVSALVPSYQVVNSFFSLL